ncbi:selenophosphate synthase [Candidatus Magnetobacterium bavaricum]|uniref:Selenophosphate synthase n=1 Tax=Candidatus Magnetobacterium bavaricum TaxID=29290 RepID=A0A0F3GP31_9BACT|nr:selenophosphate synthase [Candidatus Magnetobacterium bavaricum]
MEPLDDAGAVIVGPGDDAGVYRMGGMTIVETVDFMTPVVNDPQLFGAISAVNSLSDIYAMGGRPVAAMAVAAFPACDYDIGVLKLILKGAMIALKRAGAFLIGGHSINAVELQFGLAVTGTVEEDAILRAGGAKPGDLLVLTKPLGIGILTTALKNRVIGDDDINEAVKWMLNINDTASKLAVQARASACTDVTGFGLLGHACNMLRGSSVDFVMNYDSIPVLPMTTELAVRGICPGGAYKNLGFVSETTRFSPHIEKESRLILSDPQTSGGLLIAMAPDKLGIFEQSDVFHAVIGRVVKGSGIIIVE